MFTNLFRTLTQFLKSVPRCPFPNLNRQVIRILVKEVSTGKVLRQSLTLTGKWIREFPPGET